jgi:hypothetical protein
VCLKLSMLVIAMGLAINYIFDLKYDQCQRILPRTNNDPQSSAQGPCHCHVDVLEFVNDGMRTSVIASVLPESTVIQTRIHSSYMNRYSLPMGHIVILS